MLRRKPVARGHIQQYEGTNYIYYYNYYYYIYSMLRDAAA